MKMMKSIVVFLLVATIITNPCAGAKAAVKKPSKVVFNGITKNLAVKVKFRNTSGKTRTFGHDFSLQRREKGKWRQVPIREGYAFISVAIIVPARKSVKYSYPLKTYIEKKELRKGTYRILTSYDVKMKDRYVRFRID